MLIEFSVSNYKSFKDRQTLSMVAVPRLGKKQNTFKPELHGENFPALLKIAAVYGPNASGKSSLISAIDFVSELMIKKRRDALPAKHFRFDPSLKDQPSCFEYNFISQGIRYEYTVSATVERITDEALTYYPKGKPVFLYSRSHTNVDGDLYKFGDALEGNDIVHDAWKDLTSPKDLFLATAAQHSSEKLNQLKSASNWFQAHALCIGQDGMSNWSSYSRSFLQRNPELKCDLEKFLFELDVPVTQIEFEPIERTTPRLNEKGLKVPRGPWQEPDKDFRTKLTHTTALGDAEFDFEEESGGTQNLMGFWLPWTMIDGNEPGLVVVDELDSSLHPKIVERLINKLLESGSNTQLIFSTHDTHLMNTKLLRRDQFWITERDQNGATRLFSVYDFEGRDSEDVEKRYYEGRYRGLPILKGNG